MTPKEKGKFEDLAKQDKVRYEREMMNYVPVKGGKKKKFKDPNAPKRPPWVLHDMACLNLFIVGGSHQNEMSDPWTHVE